MKFIILTRPNCGGRIYVNPNNICAFRKNDFNNDRTMILFVGNENCQINVLESPEAIANLIEEATK